MRLRVIAPAAYRLMINDQELAWGPLRFAPSMPEYQECRVTLPAGSHRAQPSRHSRGPDNAPGCQDARVRVGGHCGRARDASRLVRKASSRISRHRVARQPACRDGWSGLKARAPDPGVRKTLRANPVGARPCPCRSWRNSRCGHGLTRATPGLAVACAQGYGARHLPRHVFLLPFR